MSAWREETATDLKDAESRLESLVQSLSGEPNDEELMSIWRAYVAIEKSIVFIRVELDEENPGRFLKLKQYSVPDERQALKFSLQPLRKARANLLLGDLVQALRDLRESRNYLRALLREKRMRRVRRRRAG